MAKQTKLPSKVSENDQFTEEVAVYDRRFDNGYDLKTNEHNNSWLLQFHPDSVQTVWMPQQATCTSVFKFVRCPLPPSNIPTHIPKCCGSDKLGELTNYARKIQGNLLIMQERETVC